MRSDELWTNRCSRRRALREFDRHSAVPEIAPVIERARDANERSGVDEKHPSQVNSNDRRPDWDVCDQRFGPRRREVGK